MLFVEPNTIKEKIIFSKRLNSPGSDIVVERIHFDTATSEFPSRAGILKSVPEGRKIPPSFPEEVLNYLFLSGLREHFPFFPGYYGSSERHIFLEDLGEDDYVYTSVEEISERLARTLARLHTATFDKKENYLSLRQKVGLPETDERVWSMEEQNAFFSMGKEFLLQNDALKNFTGLLQISEENVNNPGVFLSFIHDDLSARRQTVSSPTELYLIDFETGKYSHSLLDIVKPITGKIERKRRLNRYFLNNPAFPWKLIEEYRKQVISLRGEFADTKTWEDHLFSCFLFVSLANIGLAIRVHREIPPLTSFSDVLSQILRRLAQILLHSSDSALSNLRKALERVKT